MKDTRRMQRMTRTSKRSKRMPGFNLVSLMDIFTILVFFLLVNSSSTQQLPSSESLKLPESVSTKKPEETTVVMITDTDILVQGEIMITIEEANAFDAPLLPAIRDALRSAADRTVSISAKAQAGKKEVTIVGDKTVPFKLLKKIMNSCTQAGYETIYLAVLQKASQFGKKE